MYDLYKVVLIVNVATYWGFAFQYLELNALQTTFPDLEVLAFPSNQFGLVMEYSDRLWTGLEIGPRNDFLIETARAGRDGNGDSQWYSLCATGKKLRTSTDHFP